MDGLLIPVETRYIRGSQNQQAALAPESPSVPTTVDSPDDVLSILGHQPDYTALTSVLNYLTAETASSKFNLHAPTPKSAAITMTLVTETAPNYWTLLREDLSSSSTLESEADRLIRCLQSLAGINAILTQINSLIDAPKSWIREGKRPDVGPHLAIFLDLLAAVLQGTGSIRQIWQSVVAGVADATSKKIQSGSLVRVITNGKICSLCAQAADTIGKDHIPVKAKWLTEGAEFSKWAAQNVAAWAQNQSDVGSEHQIISELFYRCFSLGYTDIFLDNVIHELLLSSEPQPKIFAKVCLGKPQLTTRVIFSLLSHLARRFLDDLKLENSSSNEKVSAVAGMIELVVQDDQSLLTQLMNWCCTSAGTGTGMGNGIGIRRAVVAVLGRDKDLIASTLEKSLTEFGDPMYIKHVAILQQEAHAQIILLSAGYLARLSAYKIQSMLRLPTYLRTVSNRIASPNARARFLGMSVGEGLASLRDRNAKQLDFDMEDMKTPEAQWFKNLIDVSDQSGPTESLLSSSAQTESAMKTAASSGVPVQEAKERPKPQRTVRRPVPRAIIEEINSSDDEDKDDAFEVMAKTSDAEDSDEDATLAQRNKLQPPVYIRDLIAYLRDSESYDKQKLGLQTAPALIRRKANYGDEVISHAEELARLLVGLQNNFDLDQFEDLHSQAMIALVVAQPTDMGPWFARTFFEGDYSLSQRTAVLVTLGLSARELAGFDKSEFQSAAEFPSKRLPSEMERFYLEKPLRDDGAQTQKLRALPPNALDRIAKSLTSSFLDPIVVEAADAATGPDMLKLETYKARYKSQNKQLKPRVRAIPNTTAATLCNHFFSPLTAHFQFALRSPKPVVLNPAMLALYLQTLGIIVNAAGPSTLSLPQMTSELWQLLLRTRIHVVGHVSAMKGWLVAMSALLHVNENNMPRLCEEQGREIVESREWVSAVFGQIRGDDNGEENDVKALAAGVLISLNEAIEKYETILVGDLIGLTRLDGD